MGTEVVMKRLRGCGVFLLAVCLMVTAGCEPLWPFQTEAEAQPNEWDRLADQKNESLNLKKLKLEAYGKQVGVKLQSPAYQEFAVNSRFPITGSVEKILQLQADFAWVEVEKEGDSGDDSKFSYYIPLDDGQFDQWIQLHKGEGIYQVTVRLPSEAEANHFYDVAQMKVHNVNPRVERDIAMTRVGQSSGLAFEQPASGFGEASGSIALKGSLPKDMERLMVQVEKGTEKWEHVVPVRDGRFDTQIPLLYGKGVHRVTVLTPDPSKKNLFNEAAKLWVDNQSNQKREPVEYFRHYEERGVQLEMPLAGGGRADMKARIRGRIDPQAPQAAETKHLIVQTKKDGEQATYIIPVENYRFDDTFWLRFGKGTYEVTVNVPEITSEKRDYFRFFGVARYTVHNETDKDQRNLLPSRGIQSDSGEIRSLAKNLIAGKGTEREKALAIYEYVSKQIHYDVTKFKTDAFEYDDSALKTLREKKGVCQDYSFLAIALLRSIGMEARFVEGVADGNRHAWVEVKVDGNWITMDPTWGAGYLDGQDRFVQKYTTRYFDPNPGEFSKTHKRTGVMY
ncbi:transglutaminase domain-containing protein [Desmospora profundinema]|uniref:Transglutaminase-like putative cysteine protease n=1 Tax=Desmospora profundinema TaxID=1571184 RepID=A0ABU1IM95_9BACL|nr:transglutaminase-like domain-containing protein [Desmospora profundinema]MDR6225898.1 transglutaminase-like putative cysteine protease [Desmospora profundinema]